MSVIKEVLTLDDRGNDGGNNAAVCTTRKKIPPPVLPKTRRISNTASSAKDREKVFICVTEDKESKLEAKLKQMEAELKALREEKSKSDQDNNRLKEEIQETNKELKKAHSKLERYSMLSKSKKVQGNLKSWKHSQPIIPDLSLSMPHDELADPQELIKQFIESERLYLNCLEAIDFCFLQPMKMFSIFKSEILSSQQFQALFLTSPQLLIVHKLFYEHLAHLRFLPKESRLEEFLVILERFTPSFSLYAGFQSEHYMVNLQRELSQCQSKPQFSLLLVNLNQKCEGKTLVDLLRIIAGRLSEYQTLLSGFLEDRLKGTRGMKEAIIKRFEVVKRFLDTINSDLVQEKADYWNCIVEKIKVLHRVAPSSPIPMEIFHSDTRLIKQGPVNIVIKGKELQKHLLLFTSHLAIADKQSDQKLHFSEDAAMRPLVGATVFSTIDTAGQAIEPDFHSGLKEDLLGFRVNLSQDSFVIRVGKPNEKKAWLDNIEKVLQMIQSTEDSEVCEVIIPDEAPKIAAASLEKLFQQLTNPQIPLKEEFIEVFLNTFCCFTTPKDVLTALINCIRCTDKAAKTPPQPLQTSTNHVFTFNMEDGVDTESSVSASNSIQNISDYDSDCSLSDSPVLSRRESGASSNTSRRLSKSKNKVHTVKEESRISGSLTTDSDSSPYASGVPVADNINREVEMGWDDDILHQNGRISASMLERTGGNQKDFENSLYPLSQSRISDYSQDSSSIQYLESDDDEPDSGSARCRLSSQSNMMSTKSHSRSVDNLFHDTDSLIQTVRASLEATKQGLDHEHLQQASQDSFNYSSSLSQNEDRLRKQSKISEDMDEASRLCAEMLSNFQQNGCSDGKEDDDCFSPETDEMNFRKYTGRMRRNTETPSPNMMISTNRLSVTSNNLSFSEPDLVVLSLKNNITTPIETSPVRSGVGISEDNDELLTSLPATIVRKFIEPSTPQHSKSNHEKHNKGGKFRFMGKKAKQHNEVRTSRKSDPANMPDRRHTLNPSASLYFNNSENEPVKDSRLSPSRGFTGLFKKKDKEKDKEAGKRLRKASSIHNDHVDGCSLETPGGRRAGRSSSLAPTLDRHVYINIDEFGEPRQKSRSRHADGSPQLNRKLSDRVFKNFTLASKVFVILGKWIELHVEDFLDDMEIMEMLDDFIQSMISSDSAESKLAEQLFSTVNRSKLKRRSEHSHQESLESSVCQLEFSTSEDFGKSTKVLGNRSIDLSRSSNLKEPSFLKMFAEQLTLIGYSYYRSISRKELLNCNWKKKEREVLSPNVCKLIKQTNEMTTWICTEVLTQDSPASRAVVLEHFINVAMICYKQHDMHCALTIAVALGSTAIKRLTKSWDAVDKKVKQKFEKLKDISDPQEKCKKIREKLERITADEIEKNGRVPSCLPYLGAYLDLIYSLDIGIKTYNSDGLVNFAKMTKLSSLIDTFLQYQRTPYRFEPKEDVIAYVRYAKRLTENELYDLSVVKEPSRR